MALTSEAELRVETERIPTLEIGRTLGGVEAVLGQLATLEADRDQRFETLAEQVWVNVLDTVRGVYDGGDYPEEFAHLTSLARNGRDHRASYLLGESPFRDDGFNGYVVSKQLDAGNYPLPGPTAYSLFEDMKLVVLHELGAAHRPVPASIFFRVIALAPFVLIDGEKERRDRNFRTHLDYDVIKFDGRGSDPWGYLSFHETRVEDRGRYF